VPYSRYKQRVAGRRFEGLIQPPAAKLGFKPAKHKAKLVPQAKAKLKRDQSPRLASMTAAVAASGVPPKLLRRRATRARVLSAQTRRSPRWVKRFAGLIQPPASALGFKPAKHRVRQSTVKAAPSRSLPRRNVARLATSPMGLPPRMLKRRIARPRALPQPRRTLLPRDISRLATPPSGPPIRMKRRVARALPVQRRRALPLRNIARLATAPSAAPVRMKRRAAKARPVAVPRVKYATPLKRLAKLGRPIPAAVKPSRKRAARIKPTVVSRRYKPVLKRLGGLIQPPSASLGFRPSQLLKRAARTKAVPYKSFIPVPRLRYFARMIFKLLGRTMFSKTTVKRQRTTTTKARPEHDS
jgi:hypothetical protein